MSGLFNKHDEGGYATLIAIIVIVVMGILLAGLLPFGTTVTQSAAYTRNNLQAQYIAEAGAKRAIVELSNGSTNWDWLESSSNYYNNKQNVTGTTAQYGVRITPTLSGAPTAGTYTVNSTGYYGKFSKTVIVTVKIGSLPTFADFTIDGSITTENNVTLDGNVSVLVGKEIDSRVTLKNDAGKNAKSNQNITIPPVNLENVKALPKQQKELPIPSETDQNPPLSANTVYWYNDSLNFNYNRFGYKGPSNGYAIVTINGNLTWDADPCNISGNILFLVNGKVTRKSGDTNFSSCCFYCNGVDIKGTGSNISAKLIVHGDMKLNSSLTNISSTKEVFKDLATDLPTVFDSSTTVSGWAKGTCTN